MGISPLGVNGVISRTQEVSTIKQNEDNKPLIDQSNIHAHFTKEVDDKMHQVRNPEASDKKEDQYDAKEKGNGQYSGNGGKERKKKDTVIEKVITKGKGRGFDIKI